MAKRFGSRTRLLFCFILFLSIVLVGLEIGKASQRTAAGAAMTGTSVVSPTPSPPLLVDSQLQLEQQPQVGLVHQRFVTINRAALEGSSFTLRLFDTTTLTVVMDSRQSLREAA